MWTNEMIELCRSLLKQGHSSSEVARTLKTKTRNAVIGKMARLGIKLNNSPVTREKPLYPRQRRVPVMKQPHTVNIKYQDRPPEPIDVRREDGIEFIGLQPHHCRWPFGERPSVYYCGRSKVEGSSYCLEHARKSFRQTQ